METATSPSALPAPTEELLTRLRAIYEDLHEHPELSMQEHRTAGIAAAWLRQHGYEVTEGVAGEETSQGARSMLEDGMVARFPKPDVALGQHVMPLPAGRIGYRTGTILSAGDSWEITLFGRGAHASMPQKSIDPVVMAAATVMRLQTVVSREVAMTDGAVVTVGALQAGLSENVIPDKAVLRLNIRTFEPAVRERVLAAVRRSVEAEAAASGSTKPPRIDVISEYPRTTNDGAATRKVVEAFERRFGADALQEIGPATASEDFGRFGAAWKVPSVFWVVGGVDPETYRAAEAAGRVDELPVNHSPDYAPALHPTLGIGVEAMLAAAGAWLGPGR